MAILHRIISRCKVNLETGCWEFQGARIDGYGRIKIKGKTAGVHRVAWEAFNGPVPQGLFVCHHCDNPPCVNPDHLFVGTNRDNMVDMCEKGRNGMQGHPERHVFRLHPELLLIWKSIVARGESVGTAKLTESDVIEIRRLRRETGASYLQIASAFGVTRSNVGAILRRKTWTHVA